MTIVAAGWFVFLRDGGGPPTGTFMRAEHAYVDAARRVGVAATDVQRQVDIGGFDAVALAAADDMQAQVRVFERLADDGGESARLARDAARAGTTGLEAVASFRDALIRNWVADAMAARGDLERSIAKVEQAAAAWRRL